MNNKVWGEFLKLSATLGLFAAFCFGGAFGISYYTELKPFGTQCDIDSTIQIRQVREILNNER